MFAQGPRFNSRTTAAIITILIMIIGITGDKRNSTLETTEIMNILKIDISANFKV